MAKSPDAFRTISEVADWLGVQTHVLRFWESRFSQVKPVKRAGGRRYYRPSDMALLGGIKRLLHDDGVTIRGVQKILRERGVKYVASLSPPLNLTQADTSPTAPAEDDAAPDPFVIQEQIGPGVAEEYEEIIEDPAEDLFAAAGLTAPQIGMTAPATGESSAPPDRTPTAERPVTAADAQGDAEGIAGAGMGPAAEPAAAADTVAAAEPAAEASEEVGAAARTAPETQPRVGRETGPETVSLAEAEARGAAPEASVDAAEEPEGIDAVGGTDIETSDTGAGTDVPADAPTETAGTLPHEGRSPISGEAAAVPHRPADDDQGAIGGDSDHASPTANEKIVPPDDPAQESRSLPEPGPDMSLPGQPLPETSADTTGADETDTPPRSETANAAPDAGAAPDTPPMPALAPDTADLRAAERPAPHATQATADPVAAPAPETTAPAAPAPAPESRAIGADDAPAIAPDTGPDAIPGTTTDITPDTAPLPKAAADTPGQTARAPARPAGDGGPAPAPGTSGTESTGRTSFADPFLSARFEPAPPPPTDPDLPLDQRLETLRHRLESLRDRIKAEMLRDE